MRAAILNFRWTTIFFKTVGYSEPPCQISCLYHQMHDFSLICLATRCHMHTRELAVSQVCRLLASCQAHSISLPDICTESSKKGHTGFCNSGSDLIVSGHCSGKSTPELFASQKPITVASVLSRLFHC